MPRNHAPIRPSFSLLALLAISISIAVLALGGCTSPSTDTGGAAGPPWLGELLAAAETADKPAAGTVVWGARLDSTTLTVELGLYRMAQIPESPEAPMETDTWSVLDAIGNRLELPAALVWPVAPIEGELAADRPVLAYHRSAGAVSARARGTGEDGGPTVAFDWNGTTVDAAVELVQDPSSRPRRVITPEYVGLAIAEVGDQAWVLDASGRVSVHVASEVAPFAPPAEDPAPGAPVRIYSWAVGIESAELDSVLEPGLRYRVRLAVSEGEPPLVDVPFDALLPAS